MYLAARSANHGTSGEINATDEDDNLPLFYLYRKSPLRS
jgi:hypothetical protein